MRVQFLTVVASLFFTYHSLGVICFKLPPTLRADWMAATFAPYVQLIGHHREYAMFEIGQRPQSQEFALLAKKENETRRIPLPSRTYRIQKALRVLVFRDSQKAEAFLENYFNHACEKIRDSEGFKPESVSLEDKIVFSSRTKPLQFVRVKGPHSCH